MRIFNQKKGTWIELVTKPIMQLIIVFTVIFLPLFGYVYVAADFDLTLRHYLARDTALLVDTMQSMPGNIIFHYKNFFICNFASSSSEIVLIVICFPLCLKAFILFFFDK